LSPGVLAILSLMWPRAMSCWLKLPGCCTLSTIANRLVVCRNLRCRNCGKRSFVPSTLGQLVRLPQAYSRLQTSLVLERLVARLRRQPDSDKRNDGCDHQVPARSDGVAGGCYQQCCNGRCRPAKDRIAHVE